MKSKNLYLNGFIVIMDLNRSNYRFKICDHCHEANQDHQVICAGVYQHAIIHFKFIEVIKIYYYQRNNYHADQHQSVMPVHTISTPNNIKIITVNLLLLVQPRYINMIEN